MPKSAEQHPTELADLLASVAQTIRKDARALIAAAEAIRDTQQAHPTAFPAEVVPELRESFRALMCCALLIRKETDQLRAIRRNTARMDRSETARDPAGDQL